jgi:hypothetical protein
MKKILLATTASVALLAGASFVAAQSQSGGSSPSASPSSPSSGAGGGGMGAGSTGGSSGGAARDSGSSSSGGSAGSSGSTGAGQSGSSAQQTQPGRRDAQESPGQGRTGQSTQRDRDEKSNSSQSTQRERDEKGTSSQSTQRDRDQKDQTGQTTQRDREGQSPRQSTEGTRDRPAAGARNETTGSAPSASVTVNTEQRTKIKQHTSELRVGRIDRADFSISVGTKVPRTVTLHTIPSSIVQIVPAWRKYKFVMVREEIVIIDPDTFEIVAVIEA